MAKTEVNQSFGLKPDFRPGLSFGLKVCFKTKVLAEKYSHSMFSYCCTRIRTGIPAAILSALFLRCAFYLYAMAGPR